MEGRQPADDWTEQAQRIARKRSVLVRILFRSGLVWQACPFLSMCDSTKEGVHILAARRPSVAASTRARSWKMLDSGFRRRDGSECLLEGNSKSQSPNFRGPNRGFQWDAIQPPSTTRVDPVT